MRALKIITEVGLIAAALFALFLLSSWAHVCTQVAHVTLSKDRYCKLEFRQWYSGRAVLSYYENGAYVGHVQLNNDLFNDPIAMFPGPDDHSVVCVSWPDTFEAAFTVDFSQRSSHGVVIPERLRLDGQEAVDFSNFEVRACTLRETAFVRRLIETSDLKSFASYTRWGSLGENEDSRHSLLTFFKMATTGRVWNDPILKNSAPLILPEDPTYAQGSP